MRRVSLSSFCRSRCRIGAKLTLIFDVAVPQEDRLLHDCSNAGERHLERDSGREGDYPARCWFVSLYCLPSTSPFPSLPIPLTILSLRSSFPYEAHKATGNQSYCQVVSLIQARNHNFRILALTATPSGKVEGVQALIDSLHISHIEIREEGSIDIVKYVHKKVSARSVARSVSREETRRDASS